MLTPGLDEGSGNDSVASFAGMLLRGWPDLSPDCLPMPLNRYVLSEAERLNVDPCPLAPHVLTADWCAAKAHAEIVEVVEQANRRAERWHDVDAPDDLADRVSDLLGRHPDLPWDLALRHLMRDRP
jgi:hypothetical protein